MRFVVGAVGVALALALVWMLATRSATPAVAIEGSWADPSPARRPPREALDPVERPAPPARESAQESRAEGQEDQEDPLEPEEPYAEWTGHDWHGQLPTMPPGGPLRGRVFRGRRPVEGARVRVWGETIGPRPAVVDEKVAGALETHSDAHGFFDFQLPKGEYQLRADDAGDFVEVHAVEVDPGRRHTRLGVLLLFGRGTITGTVHTDAGTPLAGLPVRILGHGPEAPRHAFVTTDEHGRFEAGGLVAGRYLVVAHRSEGGHGPPSWSARSFDPREERTVVLAEGGRVELAFGFATPPVEWRGRVVDGSGAPVPGQRELLLVDPERGDTLRVLVGDEGAFEVQVPVGPWDVRLSDADAPETSLLRIDAQPYGELPDVTLPGLVLRVVVELAEGTVDTLRFHDRAMREMRLVRVHPTGPGMEHEPEDLGARRLQWVGLEAGEYVLRPRGLRVSIDGCRPETGLPVRVEPGPTHELLVRVAPD